jgi:hypothetical protein
MAQIIIWGAITKDGSVANGSRGGPGSYNFSVSRVGTGTYSLTFTPSFSGLPAISGSQWGFGNSQNTRDNVTFPQLSNATATVFTGDSSGERSDRNFSFIAIGFINAPPFT